MEKRYVCVWRANGTRLFLEHKRGGWAQVLADTCSYDSKAEAAKAAAGLRRGVVMSEEEIVRAFVELAIRPTA